MKKNLIIFIILLFSCNQYSYKKLDLDEYTIDMLHEGYVSGTFSITDVVNHYISMIKKIDRSGPTLNSIITINPDALTIAKDLDDELQKKQKLNPMYGIPVILKDNINTNDRMPTTAGSRVLKNSFPIKDSWIAKKLRESGAIIIGKANLSEWANYRASYSSSGWSGVLGQTKNPYILDRNPCGSSSGSAVAVSANLCAVAIGTETWGSIMCPSNANGIVGIKPTVGLWSRSGVIPISYTQDTAGPMARTLLDAVKLLGIIVGVDRSDPKTINSDGNFHADYMKFLKIDGLKGKKIGYLKTEEGKNFKVDSLVHKAIRFMKNQGAHIIELDAIVSGTPYENAQEVMAYEFKDGLNNYLEQLGKNRPVSDLKDVIVVTKDDSIEMQYFNLIRLENAESKGGLDDKRYKEALSKMQKAYRNDGIDLIMDRYELDAIVSPTGSPAWKTDLVNGDNFQLSTSVYAALSGYPNISIPMGFIGELPVGLSFYGREWSEPQLIEIAYSYEQGTNHRKKPKFLKTD
ncbi:MAG: amidase [Candidatus Marinimicrobia bacterium]|mgnify:FL=1|nr:amidase [Candidatus Neomarinimicrobiota bacterium]